MTSFESNNSKAVEVNGVCFETFMAEHVLTIPNGNVAKTHVQCGIRVTNLSQNSYRFIFFGLMPELEDTDGQAIQGAYARNVTKAPKESDFLLAMPEESLTFFINADLYWYNYKLRLGGYESSGGFWYFDALKPGIYKVRFTYKKQSAVGKIDGGRTPWKFLEGLWMGMVATPSVELHLI